MSNAREILTLQFGNFANYIGAHWWNTQESEFTYEQNAEPAEVCHDVLYRQGLNQNRQTTYTPRLLLVDLEGSLKHLPREGELYGNSLKRGGCEDIANSENIDQHDTVKKLKEDLVWQPANVEVVVQPETSKNQFQLDLDKSEISIEEKDYNLSENVDTWADFLYARYHPRTANIIKQYRHDSDKQALDTFSRGAELWQTEEFEEDFSDRIRQYVEECDFLQGFQTIFDAFNGFSGLASKCLVHLNDEYGKANLALPVYSPRNSLYENADEAMSDSIRVANSVLSFNHLTEQSSLFIPLSTRDRVWRQLGKSRNFPMLQFKPDNLYQTSSILATYLDTISSHYRLRNASLSNTLSGFCGDLNNYGRKLAAAALSLPFNMDHKQDLIDCLDKFEGPLFTQLTPNCQIGTNYAIQSLCIRGIPLERLKRPRELATQEQMRMSAYRCESVSHMLQLYLQCTNHNCMSHVTSLKAAMPTRIPYPCEMFTDNLTSSGFVNPFEKRGKDDKVNTVPCLAAVQSSTEVGDTLETLHREGKRIKISKLHRFKASGLEVDDYAEALENVLLFKDNYDDNFEL